VVDLWSVGETTRKTKEGGGIDDQQTEAVEKKLKGRQRRACAIFASSECEN